MIINGSKRNNKASKYPRYIDNVIINMASVWLTIRFITSNQDTVQIGILLPLHFLTCFWSNSLDKSFTKVTTSVCNSTVKVNITSPEILPYVICKFPIQKLVSLNNIANAGASDMPTI